MTDGPAIVETTFADENEGWVTFLSWRASKLLYILLIFVVYFWKPQTTSHTSSIPSHVDAKVYFIIIPGTTAGITTDLITVIDESAPGKVTFIISRS